MSFIDFAGLVISQFLEFFNFMDSIYPFAGSVIGGDVSLFWLWASLFVTQFPFLFIAGGGNFAPVGSDDSEASSPYDDSPDGFNPPGSSDSPYDD